MPNATFTTLRTSNPALSRLCSQVTRLILNGKAELSEGDFLSLCDHTRKLVEGEFSDVMMDRPSYDDNPGEYVAF